MILINTDGLVDEGNRIYCCRFKRGHSRLLRFLFDFFLLIVVASMALQPD